jgi:hypothetical protein
MIGNPLKVEVLMGKSRISPTKKGFSNAMFDHHRVYKSK